MEYIYGINPAYEVLFSGKRTVKELLYSDTKNPRVRKLLEIAKVKNIPSKVEEKGVMITLCGSRNHQGIVLHVSDYPYVQLTDMLDEKRFLLLDNIEDPHNLGAILRTAEVFGFKNVLLSNRGTPEIYASVVKVSAGATEHLSICKERNANNYVNRLKELDYKIIVLDENGKTDISSVKSNLPDKFVLVIGGEDRSVGQYIINCADYVVSFKQKGKINSLNASVAAAIGMYAFSEN